MQKLLLAAVCVVMAATAAAQSPDNARVPPLAAVVDSTGAVWTMQPGPGVNHVLFRNGTQACGGEGEALLLWQGQLYANGDGAGEDWYRWDPATACWAYVGTADPAGGPAVVEPTPVTPTSRLAWTQPGQTVAQAVAGVTTLYTDGVARVLGSVTCQADAGGTDCQAPLPALTPGAHTLAVTYRVTAAGGESARSNVIAVTTTTVLTPIGLTLK